MPYLVEPDPGHSGRFRVRNTENGDIKGSGQDKTAATKQWRLLEAVEHDKDFTPQPGAVSTLRHTPGPGLYPGSGYSRTRRNPGGAR